MRVTVYGVETNDDMIPHLVKESSTNYGYDRNIRNSQDVWNVMTGKFHIDRLTEEKVYAIALNNNDRPLGFFEVSHGLVNGSLVSPREVFMRMLLIGATAFILVHNHPSGEATPSAEDNSITEKMREAGKITGIRLTDHIIIGDRELYSYLESKWSEG